MPGSMSEPLVLHPDVRTTPVSELAPDVRDQLAPGTHSVQTRLRSRATSRGLDAAGAELLNAFETPNTVVDAVVAFAQRHQLEPKAVLKEAYPLLRQFLREGVLVPPQSLEAASLTPSLEAGGRFGVARCVQVLEDVEVYYTELDGAPAALKIARPGVDRARAFEREQRLLECAAGCRTPRVLESGLWEGRAFLRLEWIAGRDPFSFAEAASPAGRAGLVVNIVRAYAGLHAQGILHGDVHPGNILVDEHGQVTLLDFGLARIAGPQTDPEAPPRGGNALYFEPEYAVARLKASPPPPPTFKGEQYAVAVLVFRLLCGKFPIALSIDQEDAWRDLVGATPGRLSDFGVATLQDDHVLARALAKAPRRRYPSLDAFSKALAGVSFSSPSPRAPPSRPSLQDAFVDRVLQRYGWGSPLLEGPWPRAPTASVAFGAAGVALMHQRIATLREDPRLLALADAWACKALREAEASAGFDCEDLDLSPSTVGQASPLHARSGPYAIAAGVAVRRNDQDALGQALDGFLAAAARPSVGLDLTVGASSVLLGCANLRAMLVENGRAIPPALDAQGEGLHRAIWSELAGASPGDDRGPQFLGVAHGWAGILYATLRWCSAAGADPPAHLHDVCELLFRQAEQAGDALMWPRTTSRAERREFWSGWCHGSAGYVYLWVAAWRHFGDTRFLDMARGAARHTASNPNEIAQLCCGAAGQAYALLEMDRADPSPVWRRGAEEACSRAIEMSASAKLTRHSLYKGEIGTAILAAESPDSHNAHFPAFSA